MEQLILEIEAFCRAHEVAPQKILRDAINAKWSAWQTWKDGTSSPTMKSADRVRTHLKLLESNPLERASA